MTIGDKAVGLAAVIITMLSAWQHGYDTARDECKPLPSYEIKPMTHKQKIRWAVWSMRDRGYIR